MQSAIDTDSKLPYNNFKNAHSISFQKEVFMKRISISGVAVGTLLYALYMFGSCVIIMLVEALLSRIINSFVPLSYPSLTVIRIVIYSLGVPAVILYNFGSAILRAEGDTRRPLL